MKKNILFTIIFYFMLITFSYGAGSSAGDSGSSGTGGEGNSTSTTSNYDKGAYLIKKAKKLEKKNKTKKAKKKYEKALNYLIKSNKKKPNQPDTLNYLGFANRKLGNFKEAEKYYLQGLAIKPDHYGINEYLGELYIQTNRIDLAKERLNMLKNCNCEEYEELNELLKNI